MKRSTCLQVAMIIGIAGACALKCWSRPALDPDQEGVYHACQLFQDLHYLFFDEVGRHRIHRLSIDPSIPWGDWNMVIDYRFLTSLPDLKELSIASHFISNTELNMLSRVRGLELLDIRGCEGFSEFALREFQRKRPEVRILLGGKLKSLYQLPLRERQPSTDGAEMSSARRFQRQSLARLICDRCEDESRLGHAPISQWCESSP